MINQLILPRELYCPFPSACHPKVLAARDHCADWLIHFKLVRNKAQLTFYLQQGFAHMVARMFPFAGFRVLCVLVDLNTLLFLLDDYFDHMGPEKTDQDHTAISTLNIQFLAIMRYPEQSFPDMPVLVAFSQVWHRLAEVAPPAWHHLFTDSVRMIFDAALWQQQNVALQQPVRLSDFLEKRQYLGAANLATDCVSLAGNCHLTMLVLQHPVIAALTVLARNIVCWANDLFSYTKEASHGDEYNLVAIFRRYYSTDLPAATLMAVNFHDGQVKEFIALKEQLPVFDHKTDDNVRRYINGLQYIMRGNIDWSDGETTRYAYQYGHLS